MEITRTLATARLTLAPVNAGDVDDLWPFVSDPELPRLMTWEAHRERGETVAFVARMEAAAAAGEAIVWTMRRDGVLCGAVGLHDVVRARAAWRLDRAELGYWCGAPHRGQGLTAEAAEAVLAFAFGELGLHKVVVGCASENLASLRVIQKLGFRLLGEQRDHFHRFGRWWHHLSFEMTAAEHASREPREG